MYYENLMHQLEQIYLIIIQFKQSPLKKGKSWLYLRKWLMQQDMQVYIN